MITDRNLQEKKKVNSSISPGVDSSKIGHGTTIQTVESLVVKKAYVPSKHIEKIFKNFFSTNSKCKRGANASF